MVYKLKDDTFTLDFSVDFAKNRLYDIALEFDGLKVNESSEETTLSLPGGLEVKAMDFQLNIYKKEGLTNSSLQLVATSKPYLRLNEHQYISGVDITSEQRDVINKIFEIDRVENYKLKTDSKLDFTNIDEN